VRVTSPNDGNVRARGDYVLYWMIAARRTSWNFALDHAVARANELGKPLVVFEPLRCGYEWASDRMHAFVLQGMEDNARACEDAGVTYLRYVEPEPGAGSGMLAALAARACLVVTDEQPGFFLPRMVAAAAKRLGVRVEQVDGNGLLPLRATDRAFATAIAFRRVFQKIAPPFLAERPASQLRVQHRDADVPARVVRACRDVALAQLPIDHSVTPVRYRGGSRAARAALGAFIRSQRAGGSGLSPYLHFGHISAHEAFARIAEPGFRDELVTWRELAYNFCFHRDDHDRFSALPAWARATLAKHARDPRPERYTARELEQAQTADPIWNAAQRELLRDGRIHNYLRMLWGKKILEWSATPQQAFATMVELNNKYAVDGRDPNSYAGILWTLGLFDRAWGPERPIFGTVRYMSSTATKRKLRMSRYLARYS